ncbi:MAG TPA: exodeoxyribonuclease III [Woeseiaceae bacterium]|nr:exodeoxyribonuclease III [Woeseiaceae bacterium]
MKVASWNINSLKVRLQQVLDWLESRSPDVLALQEIKQVTEDFPADAFREAGYEALASGQRSYNGVATVSRAPLLDPVTDIEGFPDPQRRILATTSHGVRIINVYVPNGQSLGSDKYEYKLQWLAAAREYVAAELQRHERLLVLGDFNIAPDDRDVYDPVAYGEDIHTSGPEREGLRALMALGLTDVFRSFPQPEKSFSWWDYRRGRFRRNAGLRIDLILASEALAKACTGCRIDREPRGWERPSDHAPVIAEFDL